MGIRLIIIAGWAMLAGCGHPRASLPAKIAVLPLDAVRLPAASAGEIRGSIAREIRALGAEVIEAGRVERSAAAVPACAPEGRESWIPCGAGVGQRLEVGHVVAGAAGGLGSTYVLQLQLIEVSKRAVSRAVEETVFGDPRKLEAAIPRITARLLDVPRPRRWYERWWVWTGVGLAVTAAVVVPLAVRDSDPWENQPLP
jgi:hypothetical protein